MSKIGFETKKNQIQIGYGNWRNKLFFKIIMEIKLKQIIVKAGVGGGGGGQTNQNQ